MRGAIRHGHCDPAKAREPLKEAGYPNGFTTTLWLVIDNHSTAQKVPGNLLQQQLAQVGIKALRLQRWMPVSAPRKLKVKAQKESGYGCSHTGWSASTGEAGLALSPLFAPKLAADTALIRAFPTAISRWTVI